MATFLSAMPLPATLTVALALVCVMPVPPAISQGQGDVHRPGATSIAQFGGSSGGGGASGGAWSMGSPGGSPSRGVGSSAGSGPSAGLGTSDSSTRSIPPTGGDVLQRIISPDSAKQAPDMPEGIDLLGGRLVYRGAESVSADQIRLPNVGPLRPVPQLPGWPDLPRVAPPSHPPKDPGELAGHCGPASACAGQGAGAISGPSVSPAGGNPTPGIDPASSEAAPTEVGRGGVGSPASQANRLAFPTTIALQYSGNLVGCSGVLVSDQRILTAAHCLCNKLPLYAFFGETLVAARVRGRGLRASLFLQQKVEFYNPDFCEVYAVDRRTAFNSGDLALLTLKDRLPQSLAEAILPVDPLVEHESPLKKLYAVGFGESSNRWRPGDKNFTELDFLSRLCSQDEQQRFGCTANVESIARRPPADTCYADSGGPLFAQSDSGSPMQLIGITSRALKPGPFCGSGGIYSSLESRPIRQWLRERLRAPVQ